MEKDPKPADHIHPCSSGPAPPLSICLIECTQRGKDIRKKEDAQNDRVLTNSVDNHQSDGQLIQIHSPAGHVT